jgi:two-component system, OmpR family, copper resistance phosphate regulon response regulator CusR
MARIAGGFGHFFICKAEENMRVLIIEDDSKTACAIRAGLAAEGYPAAIAKCGNEGVRRLGTEVFDAVVLDWMLPGRDGISILQFLSERVSKPPVLLLTARDAVEDRVLGLDSGADDYLVKPFAFAELLARLRALLRRSVAEESMRKQIGDLSVDMRTRQTFRGQDEITLTPREFDLLAHLMRHEGQVVTRQMLAREVWRETNRSTPLDNVIDVHVARLRKKIDDGRTARLIHTIRGVGFLCGEKATRP